jgi:hypothetical protein
VLTMDTDVSAMWLLATEACAASYVGRGSLSARRPVLS